MTPMSTRSNVFSISTSKLSETGKIGKPEERHIRGFGGGVRPQTGAQLRGAGARIDLRLRLACRNHRLADRRKGCRPLMRDRQMPRTRRLAGAIGEELLDDAVFERMKGDDDKPPAGLQYRFRRKQRLRQFAELVVDEDAQGLEDARCRMDLVLHLA